MMGNSEPSHNNTCLLAYIPASATAIKCTREVMLQMAFLGPSFF